MALAKAELETEKSERIPCLYNPAEIAMSKSTVWKGSPAKGRDAPTVQFEGGESATLTISLTLDTSDTGKDVTQHTNALLKLMQIDTSLPGSDKARLKARPPWVIFRWGETHSFKAVLERLQLRFTYFTSGGIPLRAKADLTLKQWREEAKEYPLQNPTSHTPTPHRVHRLTQGETLDRLAARYYQDSTRWRLIAEANAIIDPLALPTGRPLIIPELPVRRRG